MRSGRRRRRLLRLLSRSLGLDPALVGMAAAASPSAGLPLPAAVPLPAADSDALLIHSRRYFSYGEDLSLRGAPELAAPFYRQAYALLAEASAPSAPHTSSSSPIPDREVTLAQRWQSRLPQLRQQIQGRFAADALQELKHFRHAGLRDPDLWNLEGLAELQLQRPAAAEHCFRQALGLQPDHYQALVNLAGVVASGQPEVAVGLLQQALRLVPVNSEAAVPALTNLAAAQRQAGRMIESALLVHQVHTLKPGHLRLDRLRQAAQTLEQMGEDQRAIELLAWLADHTPEPEPDLLRLLAELLERRGALEQAALVFRRLERSRSVGSPDTKPPAGAAESRYPPASA